MAKIDSPLGRYNLANQHNQKRFVVDDANNNQTMNQNIPEEYMHHFTSTDSSFEEPYVEPRKLQENIHKQKNNISPQNKQSLEVLLGTGRSTVDVEIDGVIFSLRTLKSSELKFVLEKIREEKLVDNEDIIKFMNYHLLFTIYKINGQPIEMIINSDRLEDKLAFIEDLDASVCSYLYRNYEQLKAKHAERYNLNTTEGMQEVIEDIKK